MWQLTAASKNNNESSNERDGDDRAGESTEQSAIDSVAVASVVLTTIPSPTQQQQQQQPQYQLKLSPGYVVAYHPPGVPDARQPALWRLQFPKEVNKDEAIDWVDQDSDIIVAVDVVQDQYNQARELASALTKDDDESYSLRTQAILSTRPLYDSSISRLYEHVQKAWYHLWLNQYLPKCIVLSALEEGLFQVLQHYQQQQAHLATEATTTTASSSTAQQQQQQPQQQQQVPRYYTTYPTQYLIPPPHPNDVSVVTTTGSGTASQQQPLMEVSISSSALLSRIKNALSLAAAASTAATSTSSTAAASEPVPSSATAATVTAPATPTPAASTDDEAMAAALSASATEASSVAVRRSRRATTPSTVAAAAAGMATQKQSSQQQPQQPMVVQKGGRIAMWLLQQMERELKQRSTATLSKEIGADVMAESDEVIEKIEEAETQEPKAEEKDEEKQPGTEQENDEKPSATEQMVEDPDNQEPQQKRRASSTAKKSNKTAAAKKAATKRGTKVEQTNDNDEEQDMPPSDDDNEVETDDNPKDDDYQSEKEKEDDDDDDDVLQDVVREHKEDLADVVNPPLSSNKSKRGKKRGRPPKPKSTTASTPGATKKRHSTQEDDGGGNEEQEEVTEMMEADEVDDHLEEDELIFSNPYFVKPTLRDIVEWLGRGQRGGKASLLTAATAELPLTLAHVQEAMAKCCWRPEPIKQQKGKSKRNTVILPTSVLLAGSRVSQSLVGLTKEDLISVDQVVLKERVAGFRKGDEENGQTDDQLVVLECQSPLDVRPKDIPKLDSAVFAKSKFALRMVDTTQRSPEQLEEWRMEQIQEWQLAEQAFKRTKNWATWRYKGIHGGYTIWPSWEHAAMEWCLSHHAPAKAQHLAAALSPSTNPHSDMATSQQRSLSSPTPVGVVTSDPDEAAAPSQELSDFVLAQSLAAASEDHTLAATTSGGTRRTARRTAATGTGESGIFYGSQSSMTQKQLMDTILRLVHMKSFQTLMGLRSVVIEESSSSGNSNPIQRMRAALGKLVWKQKRLATQAVTTKWSEESLLLRLQEGPLLTIEEHPPQSLLASETKRDHGVENGSNEEKVTKGDNGNVSAVDHVPLLEGMIQPENESGEEVKSPQPLLSIAKTDSDNEASSSKPALSTLVTEKPENGNDVSSSHLTSLTSPEIKSGIEVAVVQPAVLSNRSLEVEIAQHDGGGKAPASTSSDYFSNVADEHKEVLAKYIQSLHFTELHLRRLILQHLGVVPVHIVASAADERTGTTEATDSVFFEENTSTVEWLKTGHELLNKVIYRPSESPSPVNEHTPFCRFYTIRAFTPSVASEETEPLASEPVASDRCVVGGTVLQEPPGVERRIRFQAVPSDGQGDVLTLTEAQVRAGIVAADLEKKSENRETVDCNPLAVVGAQVTLYPNGTSSSSAGAIHGRVAGHNSAIAEKNQVDHIQNRVLIVPDPGSASDAAFWVTVQDISKEDSTIICQRDNEPTLFKVQQSDFHSSSQAFRDCQGVIDFLCRQPRSMPFMEPVDPVALNVPDYFQVVKHPMDISTLEKNLKNGQYSIIPPHQNPDRSPSARMLNGPFRDDAVLIFDNAMLFNPPNDWIHQAAATIKKNLLKKIEQMSTTADAKFGGSATIPRFRTENKSVYVDEDSDVDIYDYESDRDDDDEYGGGRGSRRKRKRPTSNAGAKARVKDDYAARPLEYPIRLANVMSDASSLRGPMANFPVNLDAASFTLPTEWSCRFATVKEESDGSNKLDEEISSLVALQKLIEDSESSALRRSTRSHGHDDEPSGKVVSRPGVARQGSFQGDFEYFVEPAFVPPLDPDNDMPMTASNRLDLEIARERLHEEYFAKLYYELGHMFVNNTDSLMGMSGLIGTYANGSFPPYLGRVIPVSVSKNGDNQVSWEIRAPYAVSALRWVLRGLIRSGHISEIDPLTSDANPSTGVVILNNLYWVPPQLVPYEVLDVKELQRRKRVTTANEEKEQVAVEMSDYEKMRAERVARNAERLKALGLA